MKTILAAAIALPLLAAAALAAPCDDGLRAVDQALAQGAVPPDQRAQVKDMRDQAASLCASGNAQEGADVLAEAKAMLGLE